VSFSARAVERITTRPKPAQSWYLDLALIADYVGSARRYHHTAPISMLYALHAGLGVVLDEGLDAVHARHRHVGALLQDALPDLGFRPFAQERRLPELTSVWLPEDVDDAKLRNELRTRFDIEVGGGLGEFAGKGWRIGLMGHSARERSVVALLGALRALL
jgi:alanine-glyoxylate transaminase/serine-glyoxylate transaminase/serine-pyruvate transaminase